MTNRNEAQWSVELEVCTDWCGCVEPPARLRGMILRRGCAALGGELVEGDPDGPPEALAGCPVDLTVAACAYGDDLAPGDAAGRLGPDVA